jgi:hypothetical protein
MTNTPTPAEMRDPGAHDRGGWLTLEEAVERYGVSQERLQQAIDEGKIAARHTGPVMPETREAWLVQPDQVERFLEDGR